MRCDQGKTRGFTIGFQEFEDASDHHHSRREGFWAVWTDPRPFGFLYVALSLESIGLQTKDGCDCTVEMPGPVVGAEMLPADRCDVVRHRNLTCLEYRPVGCCVELVLSEAARVASAKREPHGGQREDNFSKTEGHAESFVNHAPADPGIV